MLEALKESMEQTSSDGTRLQFGQRFLTDNTLVFEHNAWDNVEWDEEQEKEAQEKVSNNSAIKACQQEQDKYEKGAGNFWDDFYNQHDNKFFKDRHWLFTEFPELSGTTNNTPSTADDSSKGSGIKNQDLESSQATPQTTSSPAQPPISQSPSSSSASSQPSLSSSSSLCHSPTTRILEVGCGVGNTIFPLLETNNDPGLFVYGCDLSSKAIDIIQNSPDYDSHRCHVFVADVSEQCHFPFPPESLDFIILIFVLSAIKPDKMAATIQRLSHHLKPGGMVLFRDYGRYDLAQLRFKKGRCLEENFYVRGDGTRVYFFTQEELRGLFEGVGLKEEQNYVDRRLQVNRGRQLKMFRVWMQCKYRKPLRC